MKHIYDMVTTEPSDGGYTVLLDGKPVRTPARALLLRPTPALAEAVADEWRAQGDKLNPATMPMTGFANAAIDRVAPTREAFALSVAAQAEHDMLCYRADAPDDLVRHQSELWDPPLAWARARYDTDFTLVEGVMHRPQPEATLARLRAATGALDPFALAALSSLAALSGSLVVALALHERVGEVDAHWDAACLEENWQIEQWGEDDRAAQARADRKRQFCAAARFLALSQA